MNPNGSLVTVDTIQGSESNLVVSDVSTDPFILYLYRVIAENGAGSVASSYFDFLTPEAGMYVCMYACMYVCMYV